MNHHYLPYIMAAGIYLIGVGVVTIFMARTSKSDNDHADIAFIWPLALLAIVFVGPFVLMGYLYNLLYKKAKKKSQKWEKKS